MWHFTVNKRKLWIWIAIDRYTQEILGFTIGSIGKKTYKDLIRNITNYTINSYCTDHWKTYNTLPKDKHLVGKKHTTQIESLNANVRHYLARFRRKSRCYSKCPLMVELSLTLLFYKHLFDNLF